jgi:hypothetical protein
MRGAVVSSGKKALTWSFRSGMYFWNLNTRRTSPLENAPAMNWTSVRKMGILP